jgi:hypothetical protein
MNTKPMPIAVIVKCPTGWGKCTTCHLYAGEQGCQWYTFSKGVHTVPRLDMGAEGIEFVRNGGTR